MIIGMSAPTIFIYSSLSADKIAATCAIVGRSLGLSATHRNNSSRRGTLVTRPNCVNRWGWKAATLLPTCCLSSHHMRHIHECGAQCWQSCQVKY
jgi:hypothetical protein